MTVATMRAIVIREPGGPEVLEVRERPRPSPAPNEVLLRVMAAGLNGADLLQRRGKYPVPPGIIAEIPGLEAAGVVEAAGAQVVRWNVGDRVTTLLAGGGYAEYVAVPAGQCLPWPTGYDAVRAAALPETCCTVWSNVFEIGGLKKGEMLLVHGGSSGIGTTAIQLALAHGARVVTTVGSDTKRQLCEKLGASVVINYKQANFADHLKDVNVVLDIVGGSYLRQNLQVLAPGGRLVIIATRGGAMGELDVATLMRKRAIVTGSTLRPRSIAEKSRLVGEVEHHVWPLIQAAKFEPVIDSVFPMDQAAKAHQRLEASEHMGKIILVMVEKIDA